MELRRVGLGALAGMGLGMILFWGVVIFGLVAAVRYLWGADRRGSAACGGAEQILADRFARGEIGEDEFRQRRELLRESR